MELGPITMRATASGPDEVRPAAIVPATASPGLLPGVAVEQAPQSFSPEADSRNAHPERHEAAERRLELDPATQEMVLQIVDPRSGSVVRQVPDDAMLRIKAYAEALRRASAGHDQERVERVA